MPLKKRVPSFQGWWLAWWGAISSVLAAPSVVLVKLDEEAFALFENDPPSALDYATFLHSAKTFEPASITLAPLWSWSDALPNAVEILSQQCQDHVLLTNALLDNSTASQEEEENGSAWLPVGMTVTGTLDALPEYLSLASVPHEAMRREGKVGFIHVDFGVDARVTDNGVRVPLLARGPGGQVCPGLALVTAVEALALDWANVRLELGRHLQLGVEGVPIPLDAEGQVLVPVQKPTGLRELSGSRLLPMGHVGRPQQLPAWQAHWVMGDDREDARLLALPSGERLSRVALVAWTAQFLLEASEPEPEPEPEPKDSSPDVAVPSSSARSDRVEATYQFPDLRAKNVGLWVFGIVWGVVIGWLLFQGGSSRPVEPSVSEEELPADASMERSAESPKKKAPRSRKKKKGKGA